MAVGGDTADVGAEIAAEMEAAEQAEATMENIQKNKKYLNLFASKFFQIFIDQLQPSS